MNLVNSKDVVAGRIRDIQALAAPPAHRHHRRQRRGTRRGLAALASARVPVRSQA